jgi:mono/diheme cytochrome c family protein
LQKEIIVNGKTFNGVMPAHGSFLDDHAVASIATYVKMRFNKEKINITSAEVSKIRADSARKK